MRRVSLWLLQPTHAVEVSVFFIPIPLGCGWGGVSTRYNLHTFATKLFSSFVYFPDVGC